MTTGIVSRCPVHVDRSLRHSQAEECLAESNLTGNVEVWSATSVNPRPTAQYELPLSQKHHAVSYYLLEKGSNWIPGRSPLRLTVTLLR